MTRPIKFLSRPVWLGAVAMVGAAGLASRQAEAQFCCSGPPPNDVSDYALIYTGDPHTLFWSDSSTNSNIGIGDTGSFSGSGSCTIAGQVRFAAPFNPDATPPQFSPGSINVTGGSAFGVTSVAFDLGALTSLSRTLATITDAPTITIADEGMVDASSGAPFGQNPQNRIFTAVVSTAGTEPSSTFPAGATFTVHGTADQFVVFNIPSTDGVGFDGSIVLTGGITSDHVWFNFDAGDFNTLTGGDPLLINTGGRTTMGTFLDPNGIFNISDTVLDGRIFGGDGDNSFITRTTINAPPPFVVPVPAPGPKATLALLGAALFCAHIIGRRRCSPLHDSTQ
jgi:hypothetical protein